MAYFYVKSGGTATGTNGRYATQQTGAFSSIGAAGYYDNIHDAISLPTGANVPDDGDFILVADDHAFSGTVGANLNINNNGAFDGAGLIIASVDVNNCENYKPGASETWTDAYSMFFKYKGIWAGIDFQSANAYPWQSSALYCWTMQDCTLTFGVTNTYAVYHNSGTPWRFRNFWVNDGGSTYNGYIVRNNTGHFDWRGGGVTKTGSGTVDFIGFAAANPAASHYFEGLDLSDGFTEWVDQTFGSSTDSQWSVTMRNCLLPSSDPSWRTDSPYHPMHRWEMYNCDDSAGNQHRFEVLTGTGSAVNSDSCFITADPNINNGDGPISIEITTTARCGAVEPFDFTLPVDYADFATSGSQVVTLEIATSLTLTNDDIFAYLVYPDGTTVTSYNIVSSGACIGTGNWGADPLGTATQGASDSTLATSSLGAGDWTGEPGSPNFYKIDLDTSGASAAGKTGGAGAPGGFEIHVEVRKPSISSATLYMSPYVSLS